MEYRTLAATDIRIPVLSLGTWAMGGGDSWGPSDDKQSERAILRAKDMGMNYIDTAPAYGNGLSEELVGRVINADRHSYILATKCGLIWGDGDEGSVHKSRDGVTVRRNLSPQSIRTQVEMSLRRLKTDYLDMLITHWQSIEPYFTPIEETVATLTALQKEGKIRAFGASNVTLDQIKEYQKYGQLSLVQERYSLLSRQNEEKGRYCEEQGITFQAYSPLERGVLTGRRALTKTLTGTAKESIIWYQPEKREAVLTLLDGLEAISTRLGCSVGNLVIAWTINQMQTMNVLCGARKVEHVEENAKAALIEIPEQELLVMNSLTSKLL